MESVMTVRMKRSTKVGLSIKTKRAAPPHVTQDNLVLALPSILGQTATLFQEMRPVVEMMRDNTAAMIHMLHEQQRVVEHHRSAAAQATQQVHNKHAAAESRLLEWFRKYAPDQLDPSGSTDLYDICLRIASDWNRLRLEKQS
jgi:hypothetical protein